MERLFVFADFNWLGKAELVGELCYEKLRGSDSYFSDALPDRWGRTLLKRRDQQEKQACTSA